MSDLILYTIEAVILLTALNIVAKVVSGDSIYQIIEKNL